MFHVAGVQILLAPGQVCASKEDRKAQLIQSPKNLKVEDALESSGFSQTVQVS